MRPQHAINTHLAVEKDIGNSKLMSIPVRRKLPRVRLFCFPYAGGGISTFIPWNQLLPAHIEIAMVTLPGRGSRLIEPAFTSMSEIVKNLFDAFQETPPTIPYMFYGHSMGARVAYELMVHMENHGFPLPLHFFASGSIAPMRERKKRPIHQLSNEKFIRALGNMNSSSKEVLANEELANLLLPSLRADFEIVETYRCNTITKLRCGVSVFAGKRDEEATIEQISPWHDIFSHNTGVHWFEGNHFFIDSHKVSVSKQIMDVLNSLSI
ncbi:MAG: thioesterase domain-containing protein [Pseudomonadota bacterium]